MTISYRGMYRSDSVGKPSRVQVATSGVYALTLPIEQYESREVLPHWRELPTEKEHKALWLFITSREDRHLWSTQPTLKSEDTTGGWSRWDGIGGS